MGKTITNKYGLSDAIVKATLQDSHRVYGDISVTQLIDAPQIRHLRRNHDIEVDAMDMIWALMGTAVHHIIEKSEVKYAEAKALLESYRILQEIGEEKAAKAMLNLINKHYPDRDDSNVLLEKSLTVTIDDYTISGTLDKFTIDIGEIEDYKNCSTYAYINEEAKKKWEPQQNIYAYMLREHGYEVKESIITAIFRDYSPSAGLRTKNYPPHPVMTIPLKLYDHKLVEKAIRKRIELHKRADLGDIEPCTGKEMWSKGDTFAVKVKGRKKAIRVLPSKSLAEDLILVDGHKYQDPYIEFRPGEDLRCEKYCEVSGVCPQRQERLAQKAEMLRSNEENK